MSFIVVILVLIILALWLRFYVLKFDDPFKKQGIKPVVLGNPIIDIFKALLQTNDFFQQGISYYQAEPLNRASCINYMNIPKVMLRDPELIQQVTITDFDHYTDRTDKFFKEDIDPVFGKSLFALKGKRWHQMRTTLTPAFSGSKMRAMYELMYECGEQLNAYFTNLYTKQGDGKPLEVEFKDLTTRFTNDMIATTAFGIKIDSLVDRDNEFYRLGNKLRNFAVWKVFLLFFLPKFSKLANIKLFPNEIYKFFTALVKKTIEARSKDNIIRPDMIHLLLEARKKLEKKNQAKDGTEPALVLTDMDITAQSFLFFFGGFETVSAAMCFAVYELTVNPEIQRRLQEEIDRTLNEHNNKISYETLTTMKYLDMVISETLRKWPPMHQLDRMCTKPHVIDLGNGREIQMKDLMINISVIAIHNDEKYYPNPSKFDPDRFSDENKHLIQPGSYIPFGSGPRKCIASRFATTETKVILINLLSKFNFEVIKKTPIPFVLKKGLQTLDSSTGFWVGLSPRN